MQLLDDHEPDLLVAEINSNGFAAQWLGEWRGGPAARRTAVGGGRGRRIGPHAA
jgi:hypothetical protein